MCATGSNFITAPIQHIYKRSSISTESMQHWVLCRRLKGSFIFSDKRCSNCQTQAWGRPSACGGLVLQKSVTNQCKEDQVPSGWYASAVIRTKTPRGNVSVFLRRRNYTCFKRKRPWDNIGQQFDIWQSYKWTDIFMHVQTLSDKQGQR